MTTNYSAASLVAKLVSSKTTDQTTNHTQHGTLKLNSINAVELKKSVKESTEIMEAENMLIAYIFFKNVSIRYRTIIMLTKYHCLDTV